LNKYFTQTIFSVPLTKSIVLLALTRLQSLNFLKVLRGGRTVLAGRSSLRSLKPRSWYSSFERSSHFSLSELGFRSLIESKVIPSKNEYMLALSLLREENPAFFLIGVYTGS